MHLRGPHNRSGAATTQRGGLFISSRNLTGCSAGPAFRLFDVLEGNGKTAGLELRALRCNC
jgi:hypothetical protein